MSYLGTIELKNIRRMKAIEFLKSQYIRDEIDNWKPESLDAMASFMDAYAKQENKELRNARELFSKSTIHWKNSYKKAEQAYAKSEAENDKFRNLLIRVTVLEIETYPNRDKLLTDIDKALKALKE